MADARVQADVVVVGAGPGGLAAACVAAESAPRVILVDDTPWLGGQIWRGQQAHAKPQAQRWFERFRNSKGTLLDRTGVVAAPAAGVLLAERDGQPLELHYERLVLATGARELFLPFSGWTLPGVMGPGGLLSLAKNGWPVAGRRIIVAGTGPLLLAAADGLRKLGAHIVCIAEQAQRRDVAGFLFRLCATPDKVWQALQLKLGLLNVSYRWGTWPLRADGEGQVRQVTLSDGKRTWTEPCDVLACGFGLVPNTELPLVVGCEVKNDFVQVDKWQATSMQNVFCAGEPTGLGGADCALVEGQIAGYAATNQTGKAHALFAVRQRWHGFRTRLARAFALRAELKALATEDTILCRCEDVTLGQARQFNGWREAKLHSRCGMGPCQGRTCGAAARVILGWTAESVRPPVLPARVAALISQPALESSLPNEQESQKSALGETPEREMQPGAVYTTSGR